LPSTWRVAAGESAVLQKHVKWCVAENRPVVWHLWAPLSPGAHSIFWSHHGCQGKRAVNGLGMACSGCAK